MFGVIVESYHESRTHARTHAHTFTIYPAQTPQAPLVQNEMQAKLKMDDMPNGTNAVVAVISYTGYDMEDAMIICKGSYERGFGQDHISPLAVNYKDVGIVS